MNLLAPRRVAGQVSPIERALYLALLSNSRDGLGEADAGSLSAVCGRGASADELFACLTNLSLVVFQAVPALGSGPPLGASSLLEWSREPSSGRVRWRVPGVIAAAWRNEDARPFVDLALMPEPRCVYTRAVYETLCAAAASNGALEMDAEGCADAFGYRTGSRTRVSDFRRYAVEPALAEVSGMPNMLHGVDVEFRRSRARRGCPFESVVFRARPSCPEVRLPQRLRDPFAVSKRELAAAARAYGLDAGQGPAALFELWRRRVKDAVLLARGDCPETPQAKEFIARCAADPDGEFRKAASEEAGRGWAALPADLRPATGRA